MDMIDRVAAAIMTAQAHKGNLGDQARAAIEAMRDPTQGMRMAGHAALDASTASEAGIASKIGFAALGDAWRAMIDDALVSTDGQEGQAK